MNYERDYGNRNLLERAAQRVRGWMGHRGGGMEYDDGYRGGMMSRGWNDDPGYREMGDVSRGGYAGGMDRGYGATNWRGYNDDWNRGMGGGWAARRVPPRTQPMKNSACHASGLRNQPPPVQLGRFASAARAKA